jgi:hypothetical protein
VGYSTDRGEQICPKLYIDGTV